MTDKPKNKGFTIEEIEKHVKKYGLELSFSIIFVLTAIFTFLWGGTVLTFSILSGLAFGILGILIPKPVHKVFCAIMKFVYKDKIITIVSIVLGVLLSIFIPSFTFACIGIIAGKSISLDTKSFHNDCVIQEKREIAEEKDVPPANDS